MPGAPATTEGSASPMIRRSATRSAPSRSAQRCRTSICGHFYDQIRCPTLVLRGDQSDILRATDAAVMSGRGPHAQIVEFAGVGHAPALMADDQIAAIRDFLLD